MCLAQVHEAHKAAGDAYDSGYDAYSLRVNGPSENVYLDNYERYTVFKSVPKSALLN